MKKSPQDISVGSNKSSKLTGFVVGAALFSIFSPNAGTAKEKYSTDILDNLLTEQTSLEYKAPSIQDKHTVHMFDNLLPEHTHATESDLVVDDKVESGLDLSYNVGIPPKLNSLYKKLSSIDKAEKIANLEFTQWEIRFLETGQFMNPDWITKSSGKKASKNVVSNFSKLTEDDIDRFYKDFLSRNTNIKMSKSRFEVLSQPISAQSFFVKGEIANREQSLGPVFNTNWYLVQLPHQPLFVLKYKGSGKKGSKIFESWNIYSKSGKNAVSKPIRVAMEDGKLVVQNSDGIKMRGRCAIGVDGHLYQIDDLGNVIWKDGNEYSIKSNLQGGYTYDKQKFVAIWDYSIIDQKTDINDGRSYILFNIQPTPEKMLKEKYENKKNSLLLVYKTTDQYKRGYQLLEDEKTQTLFLQKDDFVSGKAPDVMSLDARDLEFWLKGAKDEIDVQIAERDMYIEQAKQKDIAFQNFLKEYCVDSVDVAGKKVPMLDVDDNLILIEFGMNNRYFVAKGNIPADKEPQKISLIDITTGEELSTWNQDILLTDGAGKKIDEKRVFRQIIIAIKKHENHQSYLTFINQISKFINTPMEELKKYGKGFEYRGYTIYPGFDYAWRSDWRYNVEIFEGDRVMRVFDVPVTAEMSGLDIKRAVDVAIDILEQYKK